MSAPSERGSRKLRKRKYFLSRFAREQDGTTAIELAIVAVPFFALIFGIIGTGLYFFTTFSLENAVDRAARLIRTGQAQSQALTTSQFKQIVCDRAPAYVDCDQDLRVNVAVFSTFGAINPPTCTDSGGALLPDPTDGPVPGGGADIVLVTVCYEWDLAAAIPFIEFGTLANGSALIRASAAFRNEPF